MAKQKAKKQKKSTVTACSVVEEQPRHQAIDVRRLSIMLLLLSLVAVPVAILTNALTNSPPQSPNNNPTENAPKQQQQPEEQQTQTTTIKLPNNFKNTWEMTQHYSKTYDSAGLHDQLKQLFDFSERSYDPSRRKLRLQPAFTERGAGFDRTTRHKLIHDLEQFDYFLRSDKVGKQARAVELFQNTLPRLYKQTLLRLDAAAKNGLFNEEDDYYKFTQEDSEIMKYYNRALFLPSISMLTRSGSNDDGAPLLTPRDWNQVERQWFGEDATHPHPGIVVIDNMLSPSTLQRVREYLLISTFWYEPKTPNRGRYLGAYIHDGMYDAIMTEIAYELHKAMPRVMKDHHLKEMWAYKYESSPSENEETTGIHVHADDAMVNVNLWIAPDEANLDHNTGGLVVYTVKPPVGWTFSYFNDNWVYVEKNLLEPSNYANVTIPYKQNRAVIFDSFLFHKTQDHNFRLGYENRRINLTFLYGETQSGEAKTGNGAKSEL